MVTPIKKRRARHDKVSTIGFVKDVECEILKTENNPTGESQPENEYGPTRVRAMPVMLIVISLYIQM